MIFPCYEYILISITGNRTPTPEPRALPPSGNQPSEGLLIVWSARHRQNAAGPSCGFPAGLQLPQGRFQDFWLRHERDVEML